MIRLFELHSLRNVQSRKRLARAFYSSCVQQILKTTVHESGKPPMNRANSLTSDHRSNFSWSPYRVCDMSTRSSKPLFQPILCTFLFQKSRYWLRCCCRHLWPYPRCRSCSLPRRCRPSVRRD